MEAISHKTGKVFTGKLAGLMHRIGLASPVGEQPVKMVKPIVKLKVKPKAKK